MTLRERFMNLFQPQDEDRQDIRYHGRPMARLMGFLKPHRKAFLLSLALVLLITGLELVRPMIIGNAIDRYITGETAETVLAAGREHWEAGEEAGFRFDGVLRAAGLYLGCLLLLMLCNRAQTLMLQKIGQSIVFEMRNQLFRHVESGFLGLRAFSFRLPAALYRYRVLAPLGFPDALFRSSDYFPMLPWYFLFLCGWFLGALFQRHESWQRAARVKIPLISAVGRNTIWVYMLHQPILMGLCMLLFRE